jgi:hypothetical protein
MATSASIRYFQIGTLVTYDNILCTVTDIDDHGGYNLYTVKSLHNGDIFVTLAHQMDEARDAEMHLEQEFSQEFVEVNNDNTSRPKRFSTVTDDAKRQFKEAQKNQNTVKKNTQVCKLLQQYLDFVKEERQVHMIPPGELNNILEDFIMCVKKSDGGDYEPSSIRGFIGGISRHLTQMGYTENIMQSHTFNGMREMLSSKFKVHAYYSFRGNMGGVGTCVESTVYAINKRNQRNYVGYVCLPRTLSTSHV